ncbi:putative sugar transporter [Fusarium bulbicola]|nr:putative sugar transporter [Fusarium bulbicola]
MGLRDTSVWKALSNLPFVRNFTLPLGAFCLVVGLNVLSNGFDIAIYNTVQAMDAFQHTFGDVCNPKGICHISTRNLSLLNSIPYITYAAALWVASEIGERYGRRVFYISMNIICLVGIAISYTAKSYGQILVGRSVVNMYTGMEGWLIPLFISELVPPRVRGAMVSTYVFGRLIGSLIIVIVAYATAPIPGDDSWKIPVAVLFSVPSLALLLTWFVPESPRWLIRMEREDKAISVLKYLNDSRPGYDIDEDMGRMRFSLEQNAEGSGWKDLFRGHILRRTSIAMIANFFALVSGQAFANTYGTIFIKSLNVYNPYVFTIIIKVAGIVGALTFALLVDHVGRRFFYHTLAPMAAVCMTVIGSFGAIHNPSKQAKLVIASMFPCYGFFLLGSFAPLGTLIPAKIPSPRLRDKTAMAAFTVQNLTNFVTTFTVPYLINAGYANLRAKVGFIYGFLGLAGSVWAFFYYPELKGRSLEEIDLVFIKNIPARHTRGEHLKHLS